MTFIIDSGALTSPVKLSTDEHGRTLATARIFCERFSAEGKVVGGIEYYVHVSGKAAENLAHTQKLASKHAILFAGTVEILPQRDANSSAQFTQHVQARHIGIDLAKSAYRSAEYPDTQMSGTPLQESPSDESAQEEIRRFQPEDTDRDGFPPKLIHKLEMVTNAEEKSSATPESDSDSVSAKPEMPKGFDPERIRALLAAQTPPPGATQDPDYSRHWRRGVHASGTSSSLRL